MSMSASFAQRNLPPPVPPKNHTATRPLLLAECRRTTCRSGSDKALLLQEVLGL